MEASSEYETSGIKSVAISAGELAFVAAGFDADFPDDKLATAAFGVSCCAVRAGSDAPPVGEEICCAGGAPVATVTPVP